MKQIGSRVLTAALTFTIGVTVGTFRNPPHSRSFVELAPNTVLRQAQMKAWESLLSFEGRDLRTLHEQESPVLQGAINSLTGVSQNQFLVPRLFSSVTNSSGEPRYVLVQESPLVSIPGSCGLRISVFSSEGNQLDSSEFDSGWRIALGSMRFMRVEGLDGDILEVESHQFINGRDVAKQYYALVGRRMLLIRLEDSERRLIQNTYSSPNHTIGLTRFGLSAENWEEMLRSNDRAEVLAALTWIGGVHLDVSEREPDYIHEEITEALVAADLQSRENVKTVVKQLSRSDHQWIRNAARLTAESSSDR
jgi:hypothetical protein